MFDELFSFLAHERSDVRKAATQALAQISRDNDDLVRYVCATEAAPSQLVALLSLERFAPSLGDVLSCLVNLAAHAAAADTLVAAKIVSRVMRLLDQLDRATPGTAEGAMGPAATGAFKELSLMLLSNLTAASVVAAHEVMQAQDEDMKGFYVSKLKTMMDHVAAAPLPDDAAAAASPSRAAADDAPRAQPQPRHIRKWYLQVVLNLTRTPQGQRVVCDDDDWLDFLVAAVRGTDGGDAADASHTLCRLRGAQTLGNCAAGGSVKDSALLQRLTQKGVCGACVQCLHDSPDPRHAELQEAAAGILVALIGSTEGCQAMEALNAKALLSQAIASGNLNADVCFTLRDRVLPFLDEVHDVYVVHGDEGAAAA